jgi:HEAT repeat protein
VSGIVARDPARRQRAARLAAMGRMVEAYDVLRGALERYPGEDAVVLAAVGLAGAEELPQLRDQLMERIRPETRVGTPETQRVLDAGAGYTWQYIGLLEALERAPDEKSRALLKLAANDRDPRVREVAQRVLQAVGKT